MLVYCLQQVIWLQLLIFIVSNTFFAVCPAKFQSEQLIKDVIYQFACNNSLSCHNTIHTNFDENLHKSVIIIQSGRSAMLKNLLINFSKCSRNHILVFDQLKQNSVPLSAGCSSSTLQTLVVETSDFTLESNIKVCLFKVTVFARCLKNVCF